MKRAIAVALTVGTVSIAHAESLSDVADNPLATPSSILERGYKLIDPSQIDANWNGVEHAVSNNIIYLNNCKPNGCQITPGNENSHQNRSTVPNQPSVVQPWAYSESAWQAVVACVRETYAPFNVQIVTDRPTSPGYHMAIVAGRPQDVQMQNGVGGVSPFTCGFINGGISFSFANIYGGDVAETCWTVAQETAHSWGLDHKYDNKDPMTYLRSGPEYKRFQNAAGPCGEFSQRSCQCGGSTMNSFQEIMDTFGPSGPPTPPTVTITAPANGEVVQQGFAVRANLSDDVGVQKAELFIDNNLVGTVTAAPYVFNAPANLAQGNHVVKVRGTDVAGTTAESTVTVSLGQPCSDSVACSNANDTCVEGRCVPGSGVDGGLGTSCMTNADCMSGQCASDGSGNSYCVETCNPASDGCPGDFGCIQVGTGGVCWPGAGEGGGCSTSGSGTGRDGVIFLGLGVGALLITTRRRRR